MATNTRLHLIEPLGFKLNEKAIRRAGLDYWPKLDVTVYSDYQEFLEKNPGVSREDIPTDLMTASGSGLDPHISPASAEVQIPRIVEASGLSEDEVRQIIADNTKGKTLGVFGEETVNVLGVNLDIALAMGLVGEISK